MTQDSGAQRSRAVAPRPGRVVAAALLIALVIAGIRGANPSVSFHGAWHRHGTLIGAALEVVLAALMFAVARRGAHAPAGVQPAARLRDWLRIALFLGLVLTPVSIAFTVLAKLHVRTHARPAPRRVRLGTPRREFGRGAAPSGHAEIIVLYGLLGVALLAVIVACLILAYKRRRLATALRPGDVPDDQQDELRRALQSGQTALRQVDDARAAIIACYVAMERSLAEAGAARGDAETPDELLARAASAGLVYGQAAGQLTALFYEARFSSHPLPASRKAAAEDALAALAAGPGAGTARPGAGTAGR